MLMEAGLVVSEGRPRGSRRVDFHESVELPSQWDDSAEFVNVSDDLLKICSRRISQQCTHDRKPLGIAVCYGCGRMLWSCVDGAHTFLVNKLSLVA